MQLDRAACSGGTCRHRARGGADRAPAPLSGPVAWSGEQVTHGVKEAVAGLNAAGGVLGHRVRIIEVDDHCEGEQAAAVARKLVADGVVFVAGHLCSGASIPASKIYADAGIPMISSGSTNPQLTEQGFRNVFRVVGRDDLQGRIAGDLLADRWPGGRIAIVHDGDTYGRGLAEEAKKRLNERDVSEVVFEVIEPGKVDYTDLVARLEAAGVEVLYYGGYTREAALIIRTASDRGHRLQLVTGDAVASGDFFLIAGPAADRTLMTRPPLPSLVDPEMAELAGGVGDPLTFGSAYAAVQTWAQAAERSGTFDGGAVSDTLHNGQFDTVLGTIGFDTKGDLVGDATFVWYVWENGNYAPLEEASLVR